ncbi:hypothetical protein NP493_18g10006 [Ridgeia piscesae]|uniref:Importin N-terminal domain-containing protein n=1 Tax=Ridgeia piscesae TaxID=27915 RepID=A0AAD9UKN1_RIDPI|nr:hypothetical protein NP493_18g10006 [Ridgeia piscesae]
MVCDCCDWQATKQLKVLLNDRGVVPALCSVLITSRNLQVRQYAAIILRKKLSRAKQWNSLSLDIAMNIRANILQVLLQEPEKGVRKAVVQLIATVAKHELASVKWPELFEFIQQYTHSNLPEQRELGMYVLSAVAATATKQLQPYFPSLLELCGVTLKDNQNYMVPFHTIQTLTEMAPLIETCELNPFQGLIPQILRVISWLVEVDGEKAVEALEIFDELVESDISVIVPHLKTILEFCLNIGATQGLGNGVRIKALSFVSWLVRLKKKAIPKLNLIQPMLSMLFPILCEAPSEKTDDDEDFDEAHTAPAFVASVIDVMALHLPPEQFITPLMKFVEPAMTNSDENVRRAAYVALAVSAEGCADYMKHRYLEKLLQYVYSGLGDSSVSVRNVSLFAVGQFSEHLQPDISKFSSELLPILFNYLNTASHDINKDLRGVNKTYYALEVFCENLGKDIIPYLSSLMTYLMTSLQSTSSVHAKELVISAIGATANAAEDAMVPYFPQIIEELKKYLNPTETESELKVQLQALDTLSVLARTMKKEHFQPLANECVHLGLMLLDKNNDPDLRRCVFGLFSAVSTLLKTDMQPCLAIIVRQMIESVKSTEGLTVHYSEEESRLYHLFDEDIDEDEDADDADEKIQGMTVENSYLDEKADACTSLGELSLETGTAFLSYTDECFREVMKLLDFPAANIRKSSITAVCQFCCATAQVARETTVAEAQTTLQFMLSRAVPKYLKIIMDDPERQVAMVTLEMLGKMLQNVGRPIVQAEGMLDSILICVKNVLQHRATSQDTNGDMDEEESEYDIMMVENAGEVIPCVAKLVSPQDFCSYLVGLLPELLRRTRPNSTTAEKSFAVGILAEIIEACGNTIASFAQHLHPVFMTLSKDDDEEVRSNAVFAMGVLLANSGESMYSYYDETVKNLFAVLNHEMDPRVIDNTISTLCRMILTNGCIINLAEVLPVILQCLPLKADFEENHTVYLCLAQLYSSEVPAIMELLPKVIRITAQVLGTDQITVDVHTLLVNLIEDINRKRPLDLKSYIADLPADLTANLKKQVDIFRH